jgi:hypothetical protein
MEIILRGHLASRGRVEGIALVSSKPFEFRHVDTKRGIIFASGHNLEGQSVKNKILVFPYGCGPTTEEWGLYELKKAGVVPKAIVCMSAYPCSTIGAIISNIPMVYGFDCNLLEVIQTGDHLWVDADKGLVRVSKR